MKEEDLEGKIEKLRVVSKLTMEEIIKTPVLKLSDQFLLSNRAKQLRIQKGYHSKELAKKLKIDKTTYSSYERGRRGINTFKLIKMAKIFDCDVRELIEGPWKDDYAFNQPEDRRDRPVSTKESQRKNQEDY